MVGRDFWDQHFWGGSLEGEFAVGGVKLDSRYLDFYDWTSLAGLRAMLQAPSVLAEEKAFGAESESGIDSPHPYSVGFLV